MFITFMYLYSLNPADNRAQLRELGALERFVETIGTPEMNDLHVSALNALAVCLDDADSILVRQLLEHNVLASQVVRCTCVFGV